MLILAIDTSATASAALLKNRTPGGAAQVLASFHTDETNTHSEVLAPGIQGLLAESGIQGADIDAIVVGVGPAPFTGLRVGVATARSLGFAWGTPVLGAMSLNAVAHDVLVDTSPGGDHDIDFTVAIDARRREIYWARYDRDGELVDGPHVGAAEAVPPGPVYGAGAGLYAERLAAAGAQVAERFAGRQPSAASLGAWALQELGRGRELLPTTPLYLRESDAKVPAQMKGASPS
ncbi:tRNA (adenosine(37)-N6)-threonylcarbamoyltransferase complex dimerization subunit type 1 TsaB [Arthrobacter sp. JSM 101049]|uniref:tRNA (adenosine(37)-N6)-threonylcarbamoyltransferase complex dimerization subunit type 1 TsaB n=1 Tax=Arthrobacter sp. JSM 101049 TaxID=929097 RepID=UPI003569BDF2